MGKNVCEYVGIPEGATIGYYPGLRNTTGARGAGESSVAANICLTGLSTRDFDCNLSHFSEREVETENARKNYMIGRNPPCQ